jgi:hypothetical protein
MQTTFRAIVEDTNLGHRPHRDADETATNSISKANRLFVFRFLCVSVPPSWIRFLLSAIIQAVIVLRVLMFLTFAVAPALSQPAPQPALPAVLGLFDRYPLVILAEEHWKRALGDFYISLVRHPDFPKQAGTLVLECGNSLYQPILDRYENGEDVPFEQISQVWRNTTKVLGWESPIYANLIAAVREVNRGLPPDKKIRVIASDAPIDWTRVHDERDYDQAFSGDKFFASAIEREVLAKNRKALVIMGINHVTRGGDRRGDPDVTTMIEKHAHHSTYVVLLGGINPSSDIASCCRASVVPVARHPTRTVDDFRPSRRRCRRCFSPSPPFRRTGCAGLGFLADGQIILSGNTASALNRIRLPAKHRKMETHAARDHGHLFN